MARYRHLFIEGDYNGIVAELRRRSLRRIIKLVSAGSDYVENESGHPLARRQPGGGDTCAGPGRNAMPGCWTSIEADTIAHFLSVTHQIGDSRWIHTPAVVTQRQTRTEIKTIRRDFPDDDSVRSVCTLFRQLYEQSGPDCLLPRACNTFERFCDDPRKREWAASVRKGFAQGLESRAFPLPDSVTVVALLEAFLYGQRVMHSRSRRGAEATLSRLYVDHGEELVVLAVDAAFRQLANAAFQLAPVMQLDLDYWTKKCGCAGPSIRRLSDVLKPFRTE